MTSLFSALLLSSTAILACPDLTGTYVHCQPLRAGISNDPGIAKMVISADGPQYQFSSTRSDGSVSVAGYLANGEAAETDSAPGVSPATKTVSVATCSGDTLTVQSQIAVAQLGLTLNMVQALQRSPLGDLVIDISLNGSSPVMVVCKKN
ncbi:MAG: hypothetical protein ACXVB9_05075 [Bdellovibrionota bacterium]